MVAELPLKSVMNPVSRRRFLSGATRAVAVPFVLPAKVWADPPSRKLAHAAVGATGQAAGDLDSLMASGRVEIVAVAEVDRRNHAFVRERFPQARIYQDWREMFAREGDRMDSVSVAVPDHMHAAVSMTALRNRKHLYCQKPLTRTLHEAHALRKAAREAGVVTQMGNQIHSSSEYRTAAAMIQEGVIGKVKEVHCWTGAQFPQAVRPTGNPPVPEGLDWDLWLGVAPERPWQEGIYHPFQWRGWQDFGGGAVADFGCHIMDTPFKGIGLKRALSVECTGAEAAWLETPERFRDSWPAWETFRYTFAGTDHTAESTLPLFWYDGGKQPEGAVLDVFEGRPVPPNGSLAVGTEAALLLVHYGGRPQLLPRAKDREYRREALAGSPQEHYSQFVLAALGEGKTTDHFDYAVPLAEAALLGTIAVRFPQRKLDWDTEALTFREEPAATALVRQAARKGWEMDGL